MVIGLLFYDSTAPFPLAEASLVRSNGSLKSGYVNMPSSYTRIFRRWSNALRWVSLNLIVTVGAGGLIA